MRYSDVMKCTYAELVAWVLELLEMKRQDDTVYDRNIRQARRIMELEFDLRKYSAIMVEDKQEDVVKEHGMIQSDVISNEELVRARLKRRGGGNPPPEGDWLSGMVWGTEFTARPKREKTWLLAKFVMAGVKAGDVLVIPVRGDSPVQDDKEWLWVDPIKWSEYWELMRIHLIPDNEIKDE